MPVIGYQLYIFLCTCEKCGEQTEVRRDPDKGIYNAAQAARSLGWNFGQDRSTTCNKCRKNNKYERYKKFE